MIPIPMLVHRPIPGSLAARADRSVPLAARRKKSEVRGQGRCVLGILRSPARQSPVAPAVASPAHCAAGRGCSARASVRSAPWPRVKSGRSHRRPTLLQACRCTVQRSHSPRPRGRNRFVARLGLVSDSMIPYRLHPSRRARTGLLGHAQRTHSLASRVTLGQFKFGPIWAWR